MARAMTSAQGLEGIVSRLQMQRQSHVAAVAEIDSVFARFGIKPPKRKLRSRPRTSKRVAKKAKARKRPTRRTFKVSGPQSVFSFVKRAGRSGSSGAAIVKHWNAQRRGAGAYKAVGELVRAKKLKRSNLQGQRGSRYTVA